MKSIEVTAKKPNDAIEQGLKELGVTLDQVTVEVLETGGLFRKAKVRLTVDEPEQTEQTEKAEKTAKPENPEKPAKSEKPDAKPVKTEKSEKPDAKPAKADKVEKQGKEKPAKIEKSAKPEKPVKPEKSENQKPEKKNGVEATEKKHELGEEDKAAMAQACEFIKAVVQKMGFEAEVALDVENQTVEITAPQGDDSLIIGRHGETLSAIQYLAETGARAEKRHINITVDCNGYRDRRAASLSAMARRKADECIRRNRKIKLEPMERIDRRTVHFALGDDERVTTSSEGKEPYRCVVIIPKK